MKLRMLQDIFDIIRKKKKAVAIKKKSTSQVKSAYMEDIPIFADNYSRDTYLMMLINYFYHSEMTDEFYNSSNEQLATYSGIKRLPQHVQDAFATLLTFDETGIAKQDASFPGFSLYSINYNGYSLKCFLNKHIYFSTFVLDQYSYKHDGTTICVEKDDIVLDCGAYVGDTALKFACMAGGEGKVYSFDFFPENITKFNANVALNPAIKNIELVESALWEDDSSVLYVQGEGPAARCTMREPRTYDLKVSCKSIDSFVKEKKLDKVDFIKMDIETAEFAALHGAAETIKKYRPKLAISIYHSKDDYIRLANYIHSLVPEYKLYCDHFSFTTFETILFATVK